SRPLPVISPADAAPAATTVRATIAIKVTNNRIVPLLPAGATGVAHRLTWTLSLASAPGQALPTGGATSSTSRLCGRRTYRALEVIGFDATTPAVRTQCSTGLSYPPVVRQA